MPVYGANELLTAVGDVTIGDAKTVGQRPVPGGA